MFRNYLNNFKVVDNYNFVFTEVNTGFLWRNADDSTVNLSNQR